jgi:hypothetical protein
MRFPWWLWVAGAVGLIWYLSKQTTTQGGASGGMSGGYNLGV